jgi:hypothetical protein
MLTGSDTDAVSFGVAAPALAASEAATVTPAASNEMRFM